MSKFAQVFKANPLGFNQHTRGDQQVTKDHVLGTTPYAMRSQGLTAAFDSYEVPAVESDVKPDEKPEAKPAEGEAK